MFQENKEPLQVKRVFLFLCIIPCAMAIVGIYSVFYLEKILYGTVQYSMNSMCTHTARVVEDSVNLTIANLQSAADSPVLRAPNASKEEATRYLRNVLKRNDLYGIIVADLDGNGKSLHGTKVNIAQRDYFKASLQGKSAISPMLYFEDYDKYFIATSVPIFDMQGKVKQVLVALQLVANSYFFYDISEEGTESLDFIFVDSDGKWLNNGMVNIEPFWGKVARENSVTQGNDSENLQLQLNEIGKPILFNGVESHITFAPVADTGWNVIALSPANSGITTVHTVLLFCSFFLGGVLIAMIFCMLYLYKVSKAYTGYRNFSLAVANSSGIFHFYVDAQGFVHRANEYFYTQLGRHQDKEQVQLLDHVEAMTLTELFAHIHTGRSFVLTMVPKVGQKFHMQCTVMPQVESSDQFLLLGTDISSFKASREMELLKLQHTELQQIINALPNALMVHSADGVRFANKVALAGVGASSAEDMRVNILSGMDSDTFASLVQSVQKVLTHGSTESSEFNFTDAAGQEHVLRTTQTPVYDDDGNVKYAVNLCEDITDTLRLQKQLENEVQRLHEILDNSPSGFFYTHEDIVQYCNPSVHVMMGLEVGKPVPVEKLNIVNVNTMIRDKVQSGINVYDMPVNVVDIYENERNLLVTALGTTWYGKWHTMIWAHDVTAIHKVQKELISAKDAAEAATRAKSDFLATMSHEIRTPMNAVLGFLHVFERSNLSALQVGYIDKITISAKGLLRIINDILDFSKIEANKMDLEYTAFNLYANMDAVYSIMSFTAQDKGLTFTRHVDENVPEIIMGDGERLNQVLLNLLSNGIKFTEQGSVSLHVRVAEQVDHEHFTLEFSVSDTGIGLSEEQASSLFKPFTQADTSTSRRFGGTGLGLVISQRIMRLMGGNIALDSKLGHGSTFTCSIPVRVATEEEQKKLLASRSQVQSQESEAAEAEQILSLQGKSVLVVEDNMINQEIAAAMLEEYGLHLDFANNGQEAVAAVQKKAYELIFMDLQMPVMNGLDATSEIRSLGQSIPIIAMTANVMSEDKVKCDAVGMNDHVGKPISPQALRACLLKWLASK